MTLKEANAVVSNEMQCRICYSGLLLAILRHETWWQHCNNCGVEIPLSVLIKFPR